jgi:hypothetical protein
MTETRKRDTHLTELKTVVGREAVRGVKAVDLIVQELGYNSWRFVNGTTRYNPNVKLCLNASVAF